MSTASRHDLAKRLQPLRQEHLLRWWDELDANAQASLVRQLEQLDIELVNRLFRTRDSAGGTKDSADPGQRAGRALPPHPLIRLPESDLERSEWSEAARHGSEILMAGKVGVILVAGGQGTRLGFPHPKGMYPIGPVTGASLFQLFAEQVLARSRKMGVEIPYYIMTSDVTHEETIAFLEEHGYFGLNRKNIFFFQQGKMPAVDAHSGELLLETKGKLSTSPDGHGGMLAALARAGLIDDMQEQGIEYLYYHQVDNPTTQVCDPATIGFHALHGSEMTTKVVAKRDPQERMGVVVNVDGQTQIVEYSDLPDELARERDERGQLKFWAGNTAIHVFNRTFLSQLVGDELALPFHIAHKQVACIDNVGNAVNPQAPNAIKFEQFIFDALPKAKHALVVEAARAREFNPVKNRDGHDSPATAQRAMTSLFKNWLQQAGAVFPADATIEISPLFALDVKDAVTKISPGTEFSHSIQLGEDD